MNKRVQMTNTFAIAGPTARKDYVHEYTEYVQSQTFGQPAQWEEGLKYFERDSDGAKLNKISATEFEVVSTGERILI